MLVRCAAFAFIALSGLLVGPDTQAQTSTAPRPPLKSAPQKITAPKPNAPTSKSAPTQTTTNSKSAEPLYLLRYKFQTGETIRWEVEHLANVKMSAAGSTQSADTYSNSVKAWRVTGVDSRGRATFEQSIERVKMRQNLTGRPEATYDSTIDKEAPVGFQDAAKAVGVLLATITLDNTGKLIKREDSAVKHTATTAQLTIPLPDEPVAIGRDWSIPDDLQVTGRDQQPKKIARRQLFTLESVRNGIATIKVETQLLAPVHDPSIEAQLVQGEMNGRVRFNIERGRIESQQMDLDKHLVGVQGEGSSMHYVSRFSETLLGSQDRTAAKPKIVGPPAP